MTDAPEKIWAYAGSFKMWRDHKTYQPPTQIEYTRSDIAQTSIDKANDQVRKLYQVLDNQLGTPCESIRHAQEIEELQAEVTRMREALVLITGEYDPKDYGGISEIMFTIAGDALEYEEADQ
tara:strand:+ start:393 stop:758 length:366 start_codon:yes stop_codon:yes gene_type:complete